MAVPFVFYTAADLVLLLALKARNAAELRDGIEAVPPMSIYYHTHRFLQQHHTLSPEPPNDFAYWLTNILTLRELGEAMASVDTVRFGNMEDLRAEFLRVIDDYLSRGKYVTSAPEGGEFHFMSARTFVLPTGCVAEDLGGFLDILRKVSVRSIYFHVFESRLRLGGEDNDFTAWFSAIGKRELARRLRRLDPYTMTLEGLRDRISEAVERYVRNPESAAS